MDGDLDSAVEGNADDDSDDYTLYDVYIYRYML